MVLGLLINWMPTSAEADSPTVTISDVPSGAQASNFTVTITFSEAVDGFTTSDITLNPSTLASPAQLSGSDGDTTFTLQVNPKAGQSGTLTIGVSANVVTATTGGEGNTAATDVDVSVDTEAPTPTITAPTTTQNGPFDVTVDFGENVTGFTAGDLTSAGTTLANILKSGADGSQSYTITVTPSIFSTSIGLYVFKNRVKDMAGNNNLSSAGVNVTTDLVHPTIAISDVPTTEQNGPFDLTITFSEDVTGFAKDDLTVTGEATATSVAAVGTSKTEYTATITPNAAKEGDVTVTVNADAVTDAAGNKNTASSATGNIHIDTIRPTVAISDVPTTEQNGPFDLTVTFSEDVAGEFSLLVFGNSGYELVLSGSGSSYTVTITPDPNTEEDVRVVIVANTTADAAGNRNTASATTGNIHIDNIAPTVAISDVPTTPQNGPFDLTVTFSEDVTGFATDDLTVTGEATATSVTAVGESKSEYTATITPNAGKEGDVTVTVNADAVTDNAGNANTASAVNIHIDTIVPTVAIRGVPTTEQNGAFDLGITFSETVTGFATEDLTVTGPATTTSVTSMPSSANSYIATITPNAAAEGDVTVQVSAGTVTDAAGNKNTASSATGNIHIDTIAPTPTLTAPTTPQNGAFDVTVDFGENVTGFATGDLTVTGEATATAVSGSGSSWTATITPNVGKEGDVTVQVNANAVTDAAGNENTAASTVTPAIHIDTIPPTVAISDVPTTEQNGAFDLTVTFSEDVTGFAKEGLTITGPATATSVSGSGSSYTATITPNATDEGDVTVQVSADAVTDAAGNGNTASSATGNIHIDTIAPTATISDVPTREQNGPFDLTVTFSEDVTHPFDVQVTGGASSDTKPSGSGSNWTVTITPNPNTEGTITVTVLDSSMTRDAAGNGIAASVVTPAIRIDTLAPTVEITDLPTSVKAGPFDVAITFSEAVNGFTTEDIALVGPATALLTAGTDGDAVYTARITPNPNASGNVTLQIPAGVVEDFAGHVNLASDLTDPILIDTNVLTVELEGVPDTVQLGGFSVMIVFSSDVEGFVLGDIQITGDAVVQDSTLLGSGSTYSLTITPDENTDGDVIITVPAGVAQDSSGKSNDASVPQTVSVAPSWMPDASLRAAFRKLLGLGEGEDFTQQQLRTITTLESEIIGINDLTGVEQATGLTTLVIPDSGITDITSLRRLTTLTTLDLAGNAVTDITPLSGLTKLTSLNLSGNSLTSIAALEDLTSLTTLDLSNNAFTDISPLAALTRLTTLNLKGNPIADFTPLASLTALTTLELGGTGLSSLNAISGLTGLTSLNLGDNSITDIAPLANLTALTELTLSGNTVSDLTGLSGLTALTLLNLDDNAITNLTPLTALTSLTDLDLRDNSITDVGPLAGLASLETLRLMGNPILNTSPLYPLTQQTRPVDIDIEVSQYPPWDVNEDGTVDAADAALVTAALGQTGDAIANPRTDVNADGTVDNADLTLVTANLTLVPAVDGVAGAPAAERLLSRLDAKTLRTLDRETLETHLHQLRVESDGSLKYRNAIAMLEGLLAVLRPTETRLLANYPNPFNPETWLPYELAADSSVEIFIYDARGVLVRHLELGHQPAGYYVAKSRAAYWDGRNKDGERVASGIYFYQLRAGGISQLRKMVILK